jgi:hypothetical protein
MMTTAEEDDVNITGQRLIRKTAFKGSEAGQLVWALQCEQDECGHVYGINGAEFDDRKCPKCGGGAPGL